MANLDYLTCKIPVDTKQQRKMAQFFIENFFRRGDFNEDTHPEAFGIEQVKIGNFSLKVVPLSEIPSVKTFIPDDFDFEPSSFSYEYNIFRNMIVDGTKKKLNISFEWFYIICMNIARTIRTSTTISDLLPNNEPNDILTGFNNQRLAKTVMFICLNFYYKRKYAMYLAPGVLQFLSLSPEQWNSFEIIPKADIDTLIKVFKKLKAQVE